MDSILVVDTSGSMAGRGISELKKAMQTFIKVTADSKLGSKVAIVEFGKQTRTVCSFTNNYTALLRCTANLEAGGGTPMAEGLVCSLKELQTNGQVTVVGGINILPRIILMSDGAPDSKETALAIAAALGEAGFSIVSVGVPGCDQILMQGLALISNGMFLMTSEVSELTDYFMKQVLLAVFVSQMADHLENLVNQELLRAFLTERMGQEPSDEELAMFIVYLRHLAHLDDEAALPSHEGVKCDGCQVISIVGNRYKCTSCADYDLCERCQNRGVHADHPMRKIAVPQLNPPPPTTTTKAKAQAKAKTKAKAKAKATRPSSSSVEVPTWDQVRDEYRSKYTVYEIRLSVSGELSVQWRRYSEFLYLWRSLNKSVQQCILGRARRKKFPSKTWFRRFDQKILEKRRLFFNLFLQMLISDFNRLDLVMAFMI